VTKNRAHKSASMTDSRSPNGEIAWEESDGAREFFGRCADVDIRLSKKNCIGGKGEVKEKAEENPEEVRRLRLRISPSESDGLQR